MSNAKELTAIKLPQALEFQQARIDALQEILKSREGLLKEILDELNHDMAHYGPSWLSEGLIRKIEEIVLEK